MLTFLGECYWPSVAALFFYLRYFSFSQIAILWAIQIATANILEVPTGAFADIVGRKKSILLSFVASAISLIIFPFTTAFWIFVILEMVKGLANALYSGSMEALVYDSLKDEGIEDSYANVAANFETVNWTAWAISAVGGGYLYYWQYQSPWIIQSIMFIVAGILAVKLIEPKIDSVKFNLANAIKQNVQGFKELFANNRTGLITLQLVLIGAGYIIASNILGASQAREYGMDARGTGWLFGIGCLFSVVASRYFHKFQNLMGEKKLIITTAIMLIVSFVVSKYVGIIAGSLLILMRIASSSTFRNARTVIVNRWISSRNRATALSTLSLLTQTPYILLSPLFGMMIDRTSPNQFAWWLGIGILGILITVQLMRTRKDIIKI